MRFAILVLASMFILSACGKKTHTVNEFMKHDQLRMKVLDQCDSGQLKADSEECKNAYEAKRILDNMD